MAKNLITFITILLLSITSCSRYTDIENIPAIETTQTLNIKNDIKTFTNTITNKEVSILSHIKKDGFHFYNDVEFVSENEGLIVGGSGLKIRTTKNGGKDWNEYSFSKFANTFHSIAAANGNSYIVGESKYIFKTDDFGDSWSVFNTEEILETKDRYPTYYKIKFYDDNLGFVIGKNKGKPIILKTTNGGDNWTHFDIKPISPDDFAYLDIEIISENDLLLTGDFNACYKSEDGGKTWKTVLTNKLDGFRALAFLDNKNGIIGGGNASLYHTKDGGNTWAKIELPFSAIISDIAYHKKTPILSTRLGTNVEEERSCTLFYITEQDEVKPFLTKNDSTVFFDSNAFAIDVKDNIVYALDRNNLYKTTIKELD